MESLDKNLLNMIWDLIPNNLKSFAMLTCSSWYNGIRENYEKVSTSEIAIAVTKHGYTNLLETQFSNGFYIRTYSEMMREACDSGNFVLVKYLVERCEKQYGHATIRKHHAFVVDRAAKEGDIEFLKYAVEKFFFSCRYNLMFVYTPSASAAEGGQLETLKFLCEADFDWDEEVCYNASKNGNLEMLIYARENGCDWDERTCNGAAKSGSMDCLLYAIENGCEFNSRDACKAAMLAKQIEMVKYFYKIGGNWDAETCAKAAEVGFLEGLQFAHENGCYCDARTCNQAAEGGHLECLIYAYENGCCWESEEEIFIYAAMSNNIEIVKYLLGTGCQYQILQQSKRACALAASVGAIDCLKFLHENIGVEWDPQTCELAAEHGHFECLKYALDNGCEWDFRTVLAAAEGGHFECLKYAHDSGCEWDFRTVDAAAHHEYGPHLKCLKYAIENGCEWDKDSVFTKAALSEDVECIKYLQEKGCKGNENSLTAVLYTQNIHCLKQLLYGGFPWNNDYTLPAALYDIDILKWLHENGYQWLNAETLSECSRSETIDCLVYLVENGCPMDEHACRTAISHGRIDNLEYLRKNGCPWGPDSFDAAMESQYDIILKYVCDNGCPANEANYYNYYWHDKDLAEMVAKYLKIEIKQEQEQEQVKEKEEW